jgi:hypothetical protein
MGGRVSSTLRKQAKGLASGLVLTKRCNDIHSLQEEK